MKYFIDMSGYYVDVDGWIRAYGLSGNGKESVSECRQA